MPSGKRQVSGEVEADLLPTVPEFIAARKAKYTSAQRGGVQYEGRVVKAMEKVLPSEIQLEHGPWFSFSDDLGEGLCSPDILLILPEGRGIIVAECKLTQTPKAAAELVTLYVPVIQAAFGIPVLAVEIFRNFLKASPMQEEVESFPELLSKGKELSETYGTGHEVHIHISHLFPLIFNWRL